MGTSSFEIRLCQNCGLRYPLTEDHPFGDRCPICLGTTLLVLSRQIAPEPATLANGPEILLEALLDNIRSAWNVGSIFRTADGLGIRKLHLCGITPTPENDSVTKTSLGAEENVSWEYSRNALEVAKRLGASGYRLIALEQDERALPLGDTASSEVTAPLSNQSGRPVLILGNEVTGVDPDLLDLCDHIVHIPMRGKKRSLNVEVAFGIAAYQLINGLYFP